MRTNTKLSRHVLTLLFLVYFSTSLFAQQEIQGTVSDEKTGSPLIGATVIVKGTSIGAMTSLDGDFTINVHGPEDTLHISYVGYESQEIIVGENNFFNISLSESSTLLEDVIVIGYGTVKKEDLTGAVAVVSSEDLNRTPSSTFATAIQGKAPGVLVSRSSGKPGSETSIRIRGVGSISKSANPIYVIDGIITTSLNSINPSDIESLQVLKDASSAAIYGADGANGVIIITTKRGTSGETKVSYSSYLSRNVIPRKLELMNANQYADLYNTLNERDGINTPAYSDEFRQAYYGEGWEEGTDWQDEITTPGYTLNQYLHISGGNESSNFSISANYLNETGILVNNNAQRYNVRANSDFRIGERLKIGETFNISRMGYQSGAANFNAVKVASPLMAIYDENNKEGFAGPQQAFGFDENGDGSIDPETEYFPSTGGNDKANPLGMALIPDMNNTISNFLGSLYAEFEPLKGLTFRLMPSVDFSYGKERNWTPSYDMGVRSVSQASLEEIFTDQLNLSIESQLSYTTSFGDHSISATAVHHYRNNTLSTTTPSAVGFPYETLNIFSQSDSDGQSITESIIPFKSISYLGRIIYDYKGKYLLTASIREDGNSMFGKGHRWGTFPSFSAGWKLNEDLLEHIKEINMLKIRAGWGMTGNSSIGYFQYDDFLSDATQFSPVFGADQEIATATYILSSFANQIVEWEAASMINFGVDANLFGNKVQASAEYYIKNQDKLLVQKPVSHIFGRASESGYSDQAQPWLNVGEIQNRGFEFILSYRDRKGSFSYGVSANLTTIKNEVISIPTESITDDDGYNITVEGRPIGSLYGYVAERIITESDFDAEGNYLYAIPNNIPPEPGDLKFRDLNQDGVISTLDRTLIGKPIPDFIYGLNLDLSYRQFDFSMFLNGMQNFQIYNEERANLSSFNAQDMAHNKLVSYYENYYREDQPSTEYVRADRNNSNENDRISTWWIEDGSFLRIKDVQLGYTLNQNMLNTLNLDNVRIYLSFSNPVIFTSYTGRDPEISVFSDPMSSGVDYGGYPTPRVSTIGIQIDF